ncbi:MAG: DUF5590 domain-containing protein [Sporolactobacillus sp.]
MKRWLISSALLILVCLGWGAWSLYHSNASFQGQAAVRAVSKARSIYHLDNAHSLSYFHGTNAYQVVEGTRNGVRMYVWIPDQKKKAPYIVRAVRRGITGQKALQIVQGMHLHVKQVVSVRLGAINSQPIWQITFLAPNHTYNYISIAFDTGKEVQRILNI